MRNLKRALSMLLSSTMVLGMVAMGGSAAGYQDVDDSYNKEAIEVLQAVGIMTGDENGNFAPETTVTRNQMAVIMSNLMAYNVASYAGTSPFTDVPEWAEPYVAACWTNGITAGISDTLYGGDQEVTTAQAALMIMKALGYFQYQSDFGSDWQLASVTQGNKIDLFNDVDSGVKEAMTRNDVAQLVLNGLEAGMVEADDNTLNVTTPDGTVVEAGRVTYNYVTSGQDYAASIDAVLGAADGATDVSTAGSIVQLGEKLYMGDLKKTDSNAHRDAGGQLVRTAYTDDFGRPATRWEYKANEIGTYADEADYTFTEKLTSKKLYDTLGATAAGYNFHVKVDGVEQDEYTSARLKANKSDDKDCFLKKALGGDAQTGNSAVTTIYVDGINSQVYIAVEHYYAAEVLKVNEDDGTISLAAIYGDAKTTDLYYTTDFAEDQIVMYSYAENEIQDVYAATLMEGTVSAVTSGSDDNHQAIEADGENFVADGTTYKYNMTMDSADRLRHENVNNGVVTYLDANGYVAYVDEAAITYDYAYVLSMGTDGDQYDNASDMGTTVYARLVLADGSVIKVETDVKASDYPGDTTGMTATERLNAAMDLYRNHIVAYSADKNDVYSLDAKSGALATVGANLEINNGVASFDTDGTADGRYTANDNTLFIVAESDENGYDDYNFSVYTGVKNVPDIDGRDGAKVTVAVDRTNSKLARVVYIEDADVSGAGTVVFAEYNGSAEYVKDSELGNYYKIQAVVDGEVVTLKVKATSPAADDLVKNCSGRGIVALKNISTDKQDLVTSVREVSIYNATDGDGVIYNAVSTQKNKNGTVGIADTYYTYTDDTLVVRYNYKNDLSISRLSSIKTDINDVISYVLDGDVLVAICIDEVDGGEGILPTDSVDLTVENNIPGVQITTDSLSGVSMGKLVTITLHDNMTRSFTETGFVAGNYYDIVINGVTHPYLCRTTGELTFEYELTGYDIALGELVISSVADGTAPDTETTTLTSVSVDYTIPTLTIGEALPEVTVAAVGAAADVTGIELAAEFKWTNAEAALENPYTITVTAGGNYVMNAASFGDLAGVTVAADGKTATIAGTVAGVPAIDPENQVTVKLSGEGVTATIDGQDIGTEGVIVDKTVENHEVVITVTAEGKVIDTVKVGETALTGENGTYALPNTLLTGNEVTVTVTLKDDPTGQSYKIVMPFGTDDVTVFVNNDPMPIGSEVIDGAPYSTVSANYGDTIMIAGISGTAANYLMGEGADVQIVTETTNSITFKLTGTVTIDSDVNETNILAALGITAADDQVYKLVVADGVNLEKVATDNDTAEVTPVVVDGVKYLKKGDDAQDFTVKTTEADAVILTNSATTKHGTTDTVTGTKTTADTIELSVAVSGDIYLYPASKVTMTNLDNSNKATYITTGTTTADVASNDYVAVGTELTLTLDATKGTSVIAGTFGQPVSAAIVGDSATTFKTTVGNEDVTYNSAFQVTLDGVKITDSGFESFTSGDYVAYGTVYNVSTTDTTGKVTGVIDTTKGEVFSTGAGLNQISNTQATDIALSQAAKITVKDGSGITAQLIYNDTLIDLVETAPSGSAKDVYVLPGWSIKAVSTDGIKTDGLTEGEFEYDANTKTLTLQVKVDTTLDKASV